MKCSSRSFLIVMACLAANFTGCGNQKTPVPAAIEPKTEPATVQPTIASAIRADEPKLPTTNPSPPTTALAQALTEDDKVFVKLRLPKIVWEQKAEVYTVDVPVKKVIDGKEVEITQYETRKRTITMANEKASTWRVEKLDLADRTIQINDTHGKPIAGDQVPKLLKRETPVLISLAAPPDSFHLLNVKEDTLILVVPPRVLYPPQPDLPPPAPSR